MSNAGGDNGPPSNGPPSNGPADWRTVLRVERQRLGLTQGQLAARAGIAAETVRKYESGARRPSRASIQRLMDALQVPHVTAGAILRELGFDSADRLFPLDRHPDYEFSVEQMRAFVKLASWPQFGTNNLMEIVAANEAAEALWGIDFEAEIRKRSRAQLNFLAIAAERQFSQRIGNWYESIAGLVSILKAIPQSQSMLDEPGSLFAEVFAAYAQNDPSAIAPLFALWERTSPMPAKVRWNYPVVWNDSEFGEIRFLGTVTNASEMSALSFNDWIPLDAESHRRLEAVVEAWRSAGRLASPPRRRPGPRSASRT